MKCLIVIFIAIALIDQSFGYPYYNYGDVVVQAVEDIEMEPVVTAIEDIEPMRFKKSVYPSMCPCMKQAPAPVYHAPSYKTVPCAKNLLSSCVPSVAAVPCSPPAHYGGEYKGEYSENYPQYAVLPTNKA